MKKNLKTKISRWKFVAMECEDPKCGWDVSFPHYLEGVGFEEMSAFQESIKRLKVFCDFPGTIEIEGHKWADGPPEGILLIGASIVSYRTWYKAAKI